MNAEIFVHEAKGSQGSPRPRQLALFVSPEMKLLEEPSEYLHHIALGTRSFATVRNNAFALNYWHNYCLGIEEDWRHCSIDNLIDYRTALETSLSQQTGRQRAATTVEQYLGLVVEFYDFARSRGWYVGDIEKRLVPRRSSAVDVDPLAHTRKGAAPVRRKNPIARKLDDSGTMIKPLSVRELRALLDAVGLAPSEAEPGVSTRDRLMVDWCWAVGLRVSELLALEATQLQRIHYEEAAPWLGVPITVTGKGAKRRRVSVPMWLIGETMTYIRGEREQCIAKSPARIRTQRLFVAKRSSYRCGEQIGVRRFESLLGDYYLRGGLSVCLERVDVATGRSRIVERPSHCVHDLRHTYAVLTYHAEVANGNKEPWKKIQSQLGHSSLATTTGIYLEYVDAHHEFRHASVRDLVGLKRK